MTETIESQIQQQNQAANRGNAVPIRNPQATNSLAEPYGGTTGSVRATMIHVNDALHRKLDPSIVSALQQGPRDRNFLLRIEKQFITHLQLENSDKIRLSTPFPPYQRMLVHRLADYFGLARIVEKKGQEATITLVKTAESQIPERSLLTVCNELNLMTTQPSSGSDERVGPVMIKPPERAAGAKPLGFQPCIQQRQLISDAEQIDGNAPNSSPSTEDKEQYVEPRKDMIGVSGLDSSLIKALGNPRDRKFLLKLEKEMSAKITDPEFKNIKLTTPFPPYHRMLVHRLADYFGLARIVEKKGQNSLITLVKCDDSIIPEKTLQTTLDELEKQQIEEESEEVTNTEDKIVFSSAPKIMQRSRTPENEKVCVTAEKILTIEERERQYAEVRARIFGETESPPSPKTDKDKAPAAKSSSAKASPPGSKWHDQFDPAYQRGLRYNTQPTPNFGDFPYLNEQYGAPQASTMPLGRPYGSPLVPNNNQPVHQQPPVHQQSPVPPQNFVSHQQQGQMPSFGSPMQLQPNMQGLPVGMANMTNMDNMNRMCGIRQGDIEYQSIGHAQQGPLSGIMHQPHDGIDFLQVQGMQAPMPYVHSFATCDWPRPGNGSLR